MSAPTPCLIVGAGPTGLVLALLLTRFGVPVRLIDKAAGPGTTSRALAVQARTLEFYRPLGLADAVIDEGIRIARLNLWAGGRRAAQVPLQDIGQGLGPYPFVLAFPQDVHERLLIERLQALGVQVQRDTALLRLEPHAGGAKAVLRGADGRQEVCEAAFVAGCDGASSTVREALGIGFPGGTYSGMFYVADVKASGPAIDGQLHVDLEASDFVLVFPLRGPGRARLVGVVRHVDEAQREPLAFDDVKAQALDDLRLSVEQVNWFSTYRVHHRVAQRFRQGRVFLLGDAAHIHSPVGGQGMNTGIGDAVNLAWKLAAVWGGRADERLLDSFEPERIAFARRLVATTDRAFSLVTSPGRVARFVRVRLAPMLLPRLVRMPWLRRRFFRTVSQLDVNYRGGPLSEGAAGAVQGGDRLPWVALEPGADNFEALASLDWQVHVYGPAAPAVAEACDALGLALHAFPWQADMARAGLRPSALYLVRPDGHVALADPNADPQRLRAYAQRGWLRPTRPH